MSKERTYVYAIQEQSPHGVWELTGHAFTDEKQAHAHIRKRTISDLVDEVVGDGYHAVAKSLADLSGTDIGVISKMKEESVTALLNGLSGVRLHQVAEELREGGLFSCEGLEICNIESPKA